MKNDVKLALGSFVAMTAATACYIEEEDQEDAEIFEQEIVQEETEDAELAACPAFFVSAIPQYFSPNGDGVNDVWTIMDGNGGEDSIFALSYSLRIINGRGSVVYNVNGPEKSLVPGLQFFYRGGEIFWTGRDLLPAPGPVQPPGVYFYSLTLRNCERVGTTRTGSINLFL